MDLEFRDLRYTVCSKSSKGETRDVLKGVHGRFLPGQLVAIMGPSGAGKSSLLNAISGYRSAGVTGELLVNGEPRQERMFQRSSCYITQEDLLQPHLTVKEAMEVSASLKLPKGSKVLTEEILRELGLLQHQHTKTDRLSGGQKKRLSIALELVNNPPIFFLDEPTSGLDTFTTVQCVKLLRKLADQGRNVICTIHQPAASLLEMFDVMYLLADGQCIFQGEISVLVPYLESLGLPCPRHHNPADFIIELTENQQNIILMRTHIENGRVCQTSKQDKDSSDRNELAVCYDTEEDTPQTEVTLMSGEHAIKLKPYDETTSSSSSMSSGILQLDSKAAWMKIRKNSEQAYAISKWAQFFVLLRRMFKQILRNKQGFLIQFFHHLICGILIGLCFYNMANDGTQMFNHLKLCVGLIIFCSYTQVMVPVLLLPQEVKLVKKEHFNRWYSLSSYYAALTVSKLPLLFSFNILFCTIVYFLAGVPFGWMRFCTFCFIAIMVSLAAEGLGFAVGAIFSVTNGCAIGPAAIAPFVGFAVYGFDFAHRIPLFMTVAMRTSFIRCGVVAMVLTIFGFDRTPLDCKEVYCHFSKPDVLMKYLDIEDTSVWFEIGIITVIMLGFRILCFMGLKWRFAT